MCSNPECGEIFDAPDEAAGREFPCPACGAMQMVAASGVASAPAEQPPEPAPRPPAAEPEQPEAEELQAVEPEPVEATPPPPRAEAPPAPPRPLGEDEIDLTPAVREPPEQKAPSAAPVPAAPTGANAGSEELDRRLSDLLDDTTFPLEDDWSDRSAPPGPGSYGVLENKLVTVTVLVIGLLGMSGGLLAGLSWFTTQRILAAYVGAGLGWVAGFIIAFLLVLGVDKEEVRKIRCPFCGSVWPAETETCGVCGLRLVPTMGASLTDDCLKAGSYALTNLLSVYFLAILLVVGYLLTAGSHHLVREFSAAVEPFGPVVYGLCGIIGFLIFAYWLDFFLSAIAGTVARSDEAPGLPRFWSVDTLATGLKGLGVVIVYVLPVFTMPLLPLGLLLLSTPGKRRAFDLAGAVKTAWRHARDFTILWLLLLLWIAGMVLAIVVANLLYRLRALIPPLEGASGIVVAMVPTAVAIAVIGVIVGIFGLAMFRCIGMFGRYNASALFRRPGKPTPP